MAATVSSVWAKPGAWALDAEEHEDELNREIEAASAAKKTYPDPPAAEFPPLAVAATTKTKKKSKGQTLSLYDFTTNYGAGKPSQAQRERLTHDELVSLPTGPRERSAEEMEQSRGFRNYGSYGADRSSRVSSRENSGRERVDLGPSRADEADDWSKSKKFTGGVGGGSFGGGDRRGDKVGFFGGSSRADEADNWGSNKSYAPAPTMDGGRRDRRMGFDSFASNGGGSDSDNWGKRKEESFDARRSDRGGFDKERKVVGFESSGAADAETWLKKEREAANGSGMGAARPRLNLQPRTKPINNGDGSQVGSEAKPKGSNPFGEARPREEVLKEQGKDWKEIDEKLQVTKIKEETGSRRKGFGLGRHESVRDDSGERCWRKPGTEDAHSAKCVSMCSSEKAENGEKAEENGDAVEKAEEVNAEKSENGDAEDTN